MKDGAPSPEIFPGPEVPGCGKRERNAEKIVIREGKAPLRTASCTSRRNGFPCRLTGVKHPGFSSKEPEQEGRTIKVRGFYLYLWISILAMIFISTAYGMFEYTKRYSFCKGCHEMNQAYDTWISSKHGPILGEIDNCMACHAEEGVWGYIKAKLSGIRSVYYHITGQISGHYLEVLKGSKPVYCTKSGCHMVENLDEELSINVNHRQHAQMGFDCVSCHDRIAHGWDDELRSSPRMQDTCFQCHDNSTASHEDCGMCHIYQERMLNGIGGKGVEPFSSPHGGVLVCKDCHTHACAPDLRTCTSCHEDAVIGGMHDQQAEVSIALEKLRCILRQLERIVDRFESVGVQGLEGESGLYDDARENYEFIVRDLSRGFHNFNYVKKMLEVSIEKADEAVSQFSAGRHTTP